MKNIHLVIAVAGVMVLSAMPVETYAQLLAGTSGDGEGKVYAYQGGTNWTAISPSLGYAVLDIIKFKGTLYAATTSGQYGDGIGEVWRYDGGTSWTIVGTNMDSEVCDLEIYNGQLYAGTTDLNDDRGNLYRYDAISNNFDPVGSVSDFTGIRAMYSSSYGYLQLGDINTDIFGHYDGTNLYSDANFDKSCVVDFAEYNNQLYAATEENADLLGSTNGINWSDVFDYNDAYALWKLQPFQGQLYLGYGIYYPAGSGNGQPDGRLAYMDSSEIWHSVLTVSDSIISMVAGGNTMLYFGTGAEAVGVATGSGPGYVYAYTGNGATDATLISGSMGDGVQCLYYPPEPLLITPATGFTTASGCVGGPFSITNETFSLTNTGTNSLDWSLANTSTWLDASPSGGTLTPGGPVTTVTVSLSSAAYTSSCGVYTAIVWFTNLNDGVVQSRQFTLAVGLAPVITTEPSNQTVMAGGTATFSVTASATTCPSIYNTYQFTYQWQLNGTNLPNGIIVTVAGNGIPAYSGDYGPATDASLSFPSGVAVDASGNLFIADSENNDIRKVNLNGFITTVAGNGTNGYSGDGGWATNASLADPPGIAVDASGNLFIADFYNNRIRKVDPSGIITTVAGNGTNGYSGDGGWATNASLYFPSGVAVNASSNLFIADRDNNVIRKVDPNGIITTVAGNSNPGYSGDGGAATNASLYWPFGVAVDASGNLFIADSENNVIRKVDPNGIITTVAGGGNDGLGDGGAATNARLYYPCGVAVDASGNLFIADTGKDRIRELMLFASYPTLTLCNVTTNNAGNYTVIITSPYDSVTSSVATLTVVSLPIISKVIYNTDGSVTLYLLTTPTASSRVLATTNLAPPVVWQPIYTNVAPANGAWQFTDTNASQYPIRFYRASTP